MNDQELKIKNFSQTWPKPTKNNPIVIIGTGGIVKDAHLPAYKKAGFEVIGLYDVDEQKARELAKDFNINNVYKSLDEALENQNCIFDLALPPATLLEVVEKLPENIFAIFQKPLGRSLEEGNKITASVGQKSSTEKAKDAENRREDIKRQEALIALLKEINDHALG